MVRENGGKKEQDSVTTTEAPGCEQRPRRRKRRIVQLEGGPGRPRGPRGAGAETSGLLQTVRRDKKIHGHRHRGDRIRVWIFEHEISHLNDFIILPGYEIFPLRSRTELPRNPGLPRCPVGIRFHWMSLFRRPFQWTMFQGPLVSLPPCQTPGCLPLPMIPC